MFILESTCCKTQILHIGFFSKAPSHRFNAILSATVAYFKSLLCFQVNSPTATVAIGKILLHLPDVKLWESVLKKKTQTKTTVFLFIAQIIFFFPKLHWQNATLGSDGKKTVHEPKYVYKNKTNTASKGHLNTTCFYLPTALRPKKDTLVP